MDIGMMTFIKKLFMIMPDNDFVGLSSIKPQPLKIDKTIVKAVKKKDIKLSELMRKR